MEIIRLAQSQYNTKLVSASEIVEVNKESFVFSIAMVFYLMLMEKPIKGLEDHSIHPGTKLDRIQVPELLMRF